MVNKVIRIPTAKVSDTQIQKLGWDTLACMFKTGITGMSALAIPCEYNPKAGRYPESFLNQEKRNEYPMVRSINPPKFINVWLVPGMNHNGRCHTAQIVPSRKLAFHIPSELSRRGSA